MANAIQRITLAPARPIPFNKLVLKHLASQLSEADAMAHLRVKGDAADVAA